MASAPLTAKTKDFLHVLKRLPADVLCDRYVTQNMGRAILADCEDIALLPVIHPIEFTEPIAGDSLQRIFGDLLRPYELGLLLEVRKDFLFDIYNRFNYVAQIAQESGTQSMRNLLESDLGKFAELCEDLLLYRRRVETREP